MNLSEALFCLFADKPEECAIYYGQMKDDPWQKAHDELEAHITAPQDVLDEEVGKFVTKIKMLETAYKMSGVKVRPSVFTSALYAKSEDHVKVAIATVDHRCIDCMTDRHLVLIVIEGKASPICKACKSARQSDQGRRA